MKLEASPLVRYHNIYVVVITDDTITTEELKRDIARALADRRPIKKAEVRDMPYATLHKREIQGA